MNVFGRNPPAASAVVVVAERNAEPACPVAVAIECSRLARAAVHESALPAEFPVLFRETRGGAAKPLGHFRIKD